MLILITGVPGSGKTTIAAALGRKLGIAVLHLREFVDRKGLASGFDRKMDSDLVDVKLLEKALRKEIPKNRDLIVEGHLACEIRLPADFIFVLRCDPKELEKRLRKRKYSDDKVTENLMAEMLDYCVQRSEANHPGKPVFEAETSGASVSGTAGKLIKIIAGKKVSAGKISYAKELRHFLGLTIHGS